SVSSLAQAELVARLGCEAVQLDVPMRVNLKFGRTWGDAKHSWAELERLPAAIQSASAPSLLPTVSKINGVAAHIAAAEESITLSKTPPLADLIGEQLINGKVWCPFHDDSTPSLQFYDDHYYCFGCGAHGDAIDWLRDVEGMDYGAAAELLASWSGP